MKHDEPHHEERYIEQYDTKPGAGSGRRGSVQVGGMVIENPLQVS